jgi:hypothetical protein
MAKAEWLVEGIKWAVEQKVDVLSLSLGSEKSSNRLFKALQFALNRGMIVVSAASNYGQNTSYSIGFPVRYGHIICTGAHNSAFSSIGREVDFLAPGEDIFIICSP